MIPRPIWRLTERGAIRRSTWYAGAAAIAAATSFLAAAARPGSESGAAAPEGAQVFRVKGCATCHDGPDSRPIADFGPSLVDVASWAGERVPGLSAEEYLAQSIRTPAAFIAPGSPGSSGGPGAGQMPLLQMSDAEIDAVVTYLLAASDESD